MEIDKLYEIAENFINEESLKIHKKINWSEMHSHGNTVFISNGGDAVLKLDIYSDGSCLAEWYIAGLQIDKCNDCKYCVGEIYGDKEEFECSKGYYKKFKLNVENNCKGFKPRERK